MAGGSQNLSKSVDGMPKKKYENPWSSRHLCWHTHSQCSHNLLRMFDSDEPHRQRLWESRRLRSLEVLQKRQQAAGRFCACYVHRLSALGYHRGLSVRTSLNTVDSLSLGYLRNGQTNQWYTNKVELHHVRPSRDQVIVGTQKKVRYV